EAGSISASAAISTSGIAVQPRAYSAAFSPAPVIPKRNFMYLSPLGQYTQAAEMPSKGEAMKSTMLRAGLGLAALGLVVWGAVVISRPPPPSGATSETIRIAEHRQPRIDALNKSIPDIEKQLGITIEVVEYPAPEK